MSTADLDFDPFSRHFNGPSGSPVITGTGKDEKAVDNFNSLINIISPHCPLKPSGPQLTSSLTSLTMATTAPATKHRNVGFLLFPNVQLLDLTGPYDVLAALPNSTIHLVSATLDPVPSSSGLGMLPTATYATCPALDIIIVPGGAGINDILLDRTAIAFVRKTAETAQYVCAVCTGALVLGVAGLLKGKKCTTHWAFHSLLAEVGAEPVHARVVRDGNLLTGGGVTAGIDFGLTLMAELEGDEKAMVTQLYLEYAPQPPFDAGSPDTAPEGIASLVLNGEALENRRTRIRQALEMHGDA